MALDGVSVAEQRYLLVQALLSGEASSDAVAAGFGVSRKTAFKWRSRYLSEGLAGLSDRSRAPHVHGRSVPAELAEAIIALKIDRPHWGARKLVARLARCYPDVTWPSHSTAHRLLAARGLAERRPPARQRRARLDPGPLTRPTRPGEVWCCDYKGWVVTGDGTRCEPLTVTDGYSRYVIALEALASTKGALARPVFAAAFRRHGLPTVIRTDNGSPFASTGVSGLTRLSAWWLSLGIRIERIARGKPQQNGAHERFHGTLARETMAPPAASLAAQQARFDRFADQFNHERPHEALGQVPPGDLYRPGPAWTGQACGGPPVQAGPDSVLRRVRSTGQIKWQGRLVFVAEALIGEQVEVRPETVGASVFFHAYPVGYIAPGQTRIQSPKPSPIQ